MPFNIKSISNSNLMDCPLLLWSIQWMIVGDYFLFVIYCTRFLYFRRCAEPYKRNIDAIDTIDIFTETSRIHIVHARTAVLSTLLFKCDQIAIINIRNNNNFKCRHSTKNNWAWLYIFCPIYCQYYMYFNRTNWKCIRIHPASIVCRLIEYRTIFCIFFSLKLIFVSFWNSRNNYNNYTRNHNHYTRNHNHYWVNDRYVIIYIVL